MTGAWSTKPLDLAAGPHVVRVWAQFLSVENVGAQVRLLRDGRWELLPFTSLPPGGPDAANLPPSLAWNGPGG